MPQAFLHRNRLSLIVRHCPRLLLVLTLMTNFGFLQHFPLQEANFLHSFVHFLELVVIFLAVGLKAVVEVLFEIGGP